MDGGEAAVSQTFLITFVFIFSFNIVLSYQESNYDIAVFYNIIRIYTFK